MTFPVSGTSGAAVLPCPKQLPSSCLIVWACGLSKAMASPKSAAVMLFNPCDAPKLQCLGIPFISVDARVIDIDTRRGGDNGRAGRNHRSRPAVVSRLLE